MSVPAINYNRFPLLFIALLFTFCHAHYTKQKENSSHYEVKQSAENKAAVKTITIYKAKVEAETGKKIANCSEPLTREKGQSTLGNFVCDALKWKGERFFPNDTINMVLFNRGGLRNDLPKGEIKVLNIFELMPFENEMVLLQISGEKLLAGLKSMVERMHPYFGLQLVIKDDKVIESLVNNKIIDKARTYSIVTSDYIANGGDSFYFLNNPVSRKNSGVLIRDAIIDYCIELNNNGKQITPYKDGRLKISK